MGFFDWAFGKLLKKKDVVLGICDICSHKIDYGGGYVFYSDTFQLASMCGEDIGSMHLCNACADAYITDEQFQGSLSIPSMSSKELLKDITKGREFLQQANAFGVIRICKAHGFTATQAKLKGREFALILWQDKNRCVRESTEFWKSTLGTDPPYTLADCVEIMMAYEIQCMGKILGGPVGGIMFRKALATEITCIDCKKPFIFRNAVNHSEGLLFISCPFCKAVFLKSNKVQQ